MGSEPSSSSNNEPCLSNNPPEHEPKLQTVQSFTIKPNDSTSTFDKQQQSSALEIEILKTSTLNRQARVKIFSQIDPEDFRHSCPEVLTSQHLHRQSMPLDKIIFDQDEQEQERRKDAERMKYSMEFQQMLLMQTQRGFEQHQQEYELFLTLDDQWLHQLRKRNKDQVVFEQAYRPISNSTHNVEVNRYKRVGYDGRKIQILFKQHIPRRAKYFYQIELFSYNPDKRCQFTVGFADYFKAKNNIHSKDCCIQQSYTHKEKRSLNFGGSQENREVKLSKKLRVEISREEGNAHMAVYVNRELVYRQDLMKDMTNSCRTVVPFVQTQFEGLDFGWKMPVCTFTS